MKTYLMTPDGKPVEWDGIKRFDGSVVETSPNDEPKYKFDNICEFHCEAEADIETWQQLIDETEKRTLEVFEILEQATEICIKSDGDLCSKCPMWEYGRHEDCEEWIIGNLRKLIENQKRLHMQMIKDRKERIGQIVCSK